jgi:hypothetical protein
MTIPIEIGKRFNRLTIVADAGSKRVGKNGESKRMVKAKCDCGVTCLKQFGLVRRGVVKSCGCLQREWVSKHALSRRKPLGESSFHAFYKGYYYGAKKRKLEFSLTKEQFSYLVQQKCVYCGVDPMDVFQPQARYGGYIHNGIDRVDNSKGYTLDNSVTACRTCNLAKGTMTSREFEAWINRLVAYRQQQVVV